jgi:lysophospholipase L1-like esterase
MRLPRGPVPRPAGLVETTSSSIREFASQPHVILLDEHLFEPLERPEYYHDPLHLNAEGAVRFSTILAQEVRAVLGPPPDAKP